MPHVFREKLIYHRATRHTGEAYAPVVANDGVTLAYLQVSLENETLMLQRSVDAPPLALSGAGFLFEPCFAGDWLVWVQRMGERWEIRGARWRDEHPEACILSVSAARPIHLASALNGTDGWLAWEERLGRTTRIRLGRLASDGLRGEPQFVGEARVNAYDPALTVAKDGTLCCAYAAYWHDNYRIALVRFNAKGVPMTAPLRLSDTPYPCAWPSVFPSALGGIWWSYTCYSAPVGGTAEENELLSHLKHERYLRQRQCFDRRGVVKIGWYDGAWNWAPMAAPAPLPNSLPYHVATGLVFGTEGAGHSQIMEDDSGGLHVLLRQYAAPERAMACDHASPELKVHPRFRAMQPHRMHPNLSLCSLVDRVWTPPRTIVPRAHFDLTICAQGDNGRLAVAFSEDRRRTGWSGEGEWFDDVGEIGLGVAHLELQPHAPNYQFSQLAIGRHLAGRMTNPRVATIASSGGLAERRFALGQTHCHSTLSVCQRELDRDPHFNYRFMQDVQHCDFGCLTDHDYNLWHTEMLLLRKFAEYYQFPGEFIALPAYEWTGSEPLDCTHDGGPFGHVNVLGFEPLSSIDFHTPNDPTSPGNSTPKLWQCLSSRRVLTPPHHPVDYAHGYHWKFWNDDFQPVVEIFQDDRGSSEQPGAPGCTNASRAPDGLWAVDMLRRGRRFGFIAAGDHRGFALAGVWTHALTREALYAALRERASYGTTGVHAAVLLTCNGQPMGHDGAGNHAPAHFELTVNSTEPATVIEILHNGVVTRTFVGDGVSRRWSWTEPETASGHFFYGRIHWADGELAWTSPVWI